MTPNEIDYKALLERFVKNLDYEIGQEKDAFKFNFFLHHYAKGNMTDEDVIEVRGYYTGLKVAIEILERVYNCTLEEMGVEENDT